jgi:hypothetical protein
MKISDRAHCIPFLLLFVNEYLYDFFFFFFFFCSVCTITYSSGEVGNRLQLVVD